MSIVKNLKAILLDLTIRKDGSGPGKAANYAAARISAAILELEKYDSYICGDNGELPKEPDPRNRPKTQRRRRTPPPPLAPPPMGDIDKVE